MGLRACHNREQSAWRGMPETASLDSCACSAVHCMRGTLLQRCVLCLMQVHVDSLGLSESVQISSAGGTVTLTLGHSLPYGLHLKITGARSTGGNLLTQAKFDSHDRHDGRGRKLLLQQQYNTIQYSRGVEMSSQKGRDARDLPLLSRGMQQVQQQEGYGSVQHAAVQARGDALGLGPSEGTVTLELLIPAACGSSGSGCHDDGSSGSSSMGGGSSSRSSTRYAPPTPQERVALGEAAWAGTNPAAAAAASTATAAASSASAAAATSSTGMGDGTTEETLVPKGPSFRARAAAGVLDSSLVGSMPGRLHADAVQIADGGRGMQEAGGMHGDGGGVLHLHAGVDPRMPTICIDAGGGHVHVGQLSWMEALAAKMARQQHASMTSPGGC